MTWSGLASPPDQKSFQMLSIWLRNSPVSMRSSCPPGSYRVGLFASMQLIVRCRMAELVRADGFGVISIGAQPLGPLKVEPRSHVISMLTCDARAPCSADDQDDPNSQCAGRAASSAQVACSAG